MSVCKKVGNSLADLDDFSRRRFGDIAERFQEAQRAHQRAERLMWLGAIAGGFTDEEMSILAFMGFLCQWDHDLMRSAGRPIAPWPPSVAAPGEQDR